MTIQFEEILNLSIADRLELLEKVWESIAANPEALPLTEAQRAELDRRLQAEAQNSGDLEPWDKVKVEVPRPRRRSKK